MVTATIVFAVLFLLGAAVQYNDPDPLRWILIYLAAAGTSSLAAFRSVPRSVPVAVGIVALAWAATLAPEIVGRGDFFAMFRGWEMASVDIEESREFYGLLIIAFWMAVLTAVPAAARVQRYRR